MRAMSLLNKNHDSKYPLTLKRQPLFCAPAFPAEKTQPSQPGRRAQQIRSSFALQKSMAKTRSKRYRAALQKVDVKKALPLGEAVTVLKSLPPTKFDQTVTLSFRLGVDPRQSDQMVRGTCPLPHGSGKKVRVLVFAEGAAAEAARSAGAEFVGYKDMIEKCNGGFQDFDVAVATPTAMAEVRKLGKVLGPVSYTHLRAHETPEHLVCRLL